MATSAAVLPPQAPAAASAASSAPPPPPPPSRVILATGSFDFSIRLWDAAAGLSYKTFAHPEKQVNCLCVSPDKAHLAAGGNPLIRWYDVNGGGSDPLT